MNTDQEYRPAAPRNPMAAAALALGVISLLTCLFFYISIPCGALAILFAILARGREPMPGRGRVGLTCGICGVALSLALIVSSVWMMLTNHQLRSYLEYYMQYYLQDPSFDLEEQLGELFPFLEGFFGEDSDEDPTAPYAPPAEEEGTFI